MSNTFLRLSVLFVVLGVSLGYWMGATHNFIVSPVHAHINLLGWVSMFLYGLFYRVFPEAALGWLPKVHLGLAVVGLPVMMVGLTIQLLAMASLMPVVPILMIVGPTMVVLGMFAFAVIVFRATGGKSAAIA
jgi:uncharacterized membrane protein